MNFSRLEQSVGCLWSPSIWGRKPECGGNAGAHQVICSNSNDCSIRLLLHPCLVLVQPNASKKMVMTVCEHSQTHSRRNSLAPVSLDHIGRILVPLIAISFWHTTTCASVLKWDNTVFKSWDQKLWLTRALSAVEDAIRHRNFLSFSWKEKSRSHLSCSMGAMFSQVLLEDTVLSTSVMHKHHPEVSGTLSH